MIHYYQIDVKEAIQEIESETQADWIALYDATDEEIEKCLQAYKLPEDLLARIRQEEEVARLEIYQSDELKEVQILVLTNLTNQRDKRIEERLEPIIFIFSDTVMLTLTTAESNFFPRLLEKHGSAVDSKESLTAYAILMIYSHYIQELRKIKEVIDALDDDARETTKNEALDRLANTERVVIFLDHTLQEQKETLQTFFEETKFAEQLSDTKLRYEINLRQKYAEKMVRLYRDLLENVGGLFSDMMSNNLNHLMKFLDSAALVVSVPAMIAGIWGMNTGGLPGGKSNFGFLAVSAGAMFLAILTAIYLRNKKYSK